MAELRIVDHTRDRYHSLAISSVWELGRIRGAKVLVVGAGALGNEVCKSLSMMGVKFIAVLDRDTVELANLSRSVFFRERDHGRPKSEVVCERLKDLNPDVETVGLNGDLDLKLGLGLVRRMDVVFSCLDSRLARRSLNRMCGRVGTPWVDGAMEDLLGEVAVYLPGHGPCYECNLSHEEKTRIAEAASCRGIALRNLSLGKVPTTPTMGSIIAALQVQEAVKVLHRDPKVIAGRRLVVNCNLNDFYITSSERNEDCEGHEQFGEITQVQAFTTQATSARDILALFREATGEEGFVELGREIVVGFHCASCGQSEVCGEPIGNVEEAQQFCPNCGASRELNTTHVARSEDAHSDWPLSRLSVPKLEVLETRGLRSVRWYELTGDCESLGLSTDSKPASPLWAEASLTVQV